MVTRMLTMFMMALISFSFLFPIRTAAATQGVENIRAVQQYVDQALADARQGQLSKAQQDYETFRSAWLKVEDTVKHDSGQAYADIESNMGQIEYAFIQNKQDAIVSALQGLLDVQLRYVQGQYATSTSFQKKDISLRDFIDLLNQTKSALEHQNQQQAAQDMDNVRQSWLSVEGVVVAQSQTMYNDTERDLVIVDSMIKHNDHQAAVNLLNHMIRYLSPLAQKSGYTIWDAMMIPIREGLEALLVVAALLAYVKKSGEGRGKGWIWLGIGAGLGLSIVLAVIVKFVFSSGAFGHNNFLISGWTGVFAAVMLLYMSYWLHSKSNVTEWQKFIATKSQNALNTGRLVSFGVLSFLAIFREGTETVLFLVGMVNQISVQNLVIGLLIGVGVLVVIAWLMLVIGLKLPIRPFFMISSLIVFYLCIKFTGMGIHSLQLAGMLPSTSAPVLPSLDFLALYPSWQSLIPQLILVVFALGVLIWKRRQDTTRGPVTTGTAKDTTQ